MNSSLIYGTVVGSIFFLFVVRHCYEASKAFLRSPAARSWLAKYLFATVRSRCRFHPAISWANLFVQIIYWAGTITFNTLGVTSLQDGSDRAISVTAVNLIPLLLSDRISFLADVLDLSSRTVLQVHKSVGFMTVLQAATHLILQTIVNGFDWGRPNDLNSFLITAPLAVMLLMALPLPRRYAYETFHICHIILTGLVLYGSWQRLGNGFHHSRHFLVIAAGFYILSMAFRVSHTIYSNFARKLGWSSALVTRYDEAVRLDVTLPRRCKFRPDQHVYLWAPGVSFASKFQTHPFSVAWWDEDEDGYTKSAAFLIKSQRGFSRSLASVPSSQNPLSVILEGPYGGGVETFAYGTIILLATGIGIATQLSLAKTAMADVKARRNVLRRISIIWQMDQESEEELVREWMQEMLNADTEREIFYCHQYVVGGFKNKTTEYGTKERYGGRVKKLYGKADVREVMAKEFEQAVGKVLVTVAAEPEFRDEVRGLSSTFDTRTTYHEMGFQPSEPRSLWKFKKHQDPFRGVI